MFAKAHSKFAKSSGSTVSVPFRRAVAAASGGAGSGAASAAELAVLAKMLRWPPPALFPALDLARLLALDAAAAAQLAADAGPVEASSTGGRGQTPFFMRAPHERLALLLFSPLGLACLLARDAAAACSRPVMRAHPGMQHGRARLGSMCHAGFAGHGFPCCCFIHRAPLACWRSTPRPPRSWLQGLATPPAQLGCATHK